MTVGWKAFKPHNWVAMTVFSWGLVSTMQSTCTTWSGLMTCRVFLGIIEACYGPGVPLYLSYFYPREKLGLRTGIFLSGSALANAYGGVLAYGISQAKGSIGAWRILFIVEGVPTCLIAAVAWYFIPDSPATARFLTPRQKEVAIELSLRQPGDRSGNEGLQWKQVVGALVDYRSTLSIPSIGASSDRVQVTFPPLCTLDAMCALDPFLSSSRPSSQKWATSPRSKPTVSPHLLMCCVGS